MKASNKIAIAAWMAAFLTLLAGLFWSRHIDTPYLVAQFVLWPAALLLLLRARTSRMVSTPLVAAVALLGVSLAGQGYIAWRIAHIGDNWDKVLAHRQASMHAMLDKRIGRSIETAAAASSQAARIAATHDTVALFRELAALRERTKVDAIAVFGETELIAWAGDHRAQLPASVRAGAPRAVFVEQPLYSYLYIPARVPGTHRHVITAVLFGTAIHEHAHDIGDRSIAHVISHLDVTFRAGKGPANSWPLVIGRDTVAHARIGMLTQADFRNEARRTAQRITCILGGIALLLLSFAWLRRPTRTYATPVPLIAAAVALAFAPLRSFGLDALFSPALFLLPLPADVSLGTLLAVLLALGALAASAQRRVRAARVPALLLTVGALAVAAGYPGAIRLLVGPGAGNTGESVRAATTQLLLGGPALWFGLQVATVLLLGILTEFALPRWKWKARAPWAVMLGGAAASSAALSLIVLMLGQTMQWVSPWLAVSWALPFLLAAFALAAYHGSWIRMMRWITAGWLAASAVLPYMWIAHTDARLKEAERQLATLGANPDPYLEYLLMQFSHEASSRSRAGETGYLLLYRSWVASGLARENYPARLTLWTRDGVPEYQLPLGNVDVDAATRPAAVPVYLRAAFERVKQRPDSAELMRVQAVPDVNQALIIGVDAAHILTVEVPPRRSLEHRDIPFIATDAPEDTHVELVPARGMKADRKWVPGPNGWRNESQVKFADGEYHAHIDVHLPRFGVRVARGVLLLSFDITLFTLLWLLGRAARGEHLALRAHWRNWRGSFRARVTATLFFFFLIPTAVFGWVAYSALAREVTRATRTVAERAVQQAVVEFQEANFDLAELSRHAGADVLYYYQGELARASVPEARDLGIYGAWMPPSIYLALTRGDNDAAVSDRRIAGLQVVTAYRSLIPAGTLAVPMPLESGDTAIRQQELAHLILFSAIVGAILSLLLSIIVGRALTGPIGRLQRAAAQVGAGNLRVRMPEQTGDEFGELYASFNRMVRRLRRARTQQIRTARVLAWGEMARQVAHEIKNPLTPIKLAVQHLKRAYADRKPNFDEILDENVHQILLEIDRLSEISRAFSRYGAPDASAGPLEPVDVRQIIHEALTLYRAGDVDVVYRDRIDPAVARAMGRSGELKEVLLNLLENARIAVEDRGGEICVAAALVNDRVEISVADNGPGIPADFLPRVFDPHFSTRSAGTGLGLAIVRRLVESWGGNVTAESEPGAGTVIRVFLRPAD